MDILFFTGSCYSCRTYCPPCEKVNFRKIIKRMRSSCQELLISCAWNGVKFNCCEEFLPLETEYGICFTLNSLHTKRDGNASSSKLNLVMNHKTGPGEMFIQAKEDFRIYIHAPEDVPFINSEPDYRKDITLEEVYNISLSIIELHNDESVKYVSIDKRQCRFPWEKPANLKVYDNYSYSTCVVQCHAENHIRLCNCTHHLMPAYNKQGYCNIEGLKCLTDNFDTVNRLHAKGYNKTGLVCDCLPSCLEPEYTVVSCIKGSTNEYAEAFVKVQSLPTSRYKRVVVRTTLDLYVAIGGTAGLFIGASSLSVVEIIYLIFVRKDKKMQ